MKDFKVPIQSLIDHIKTACDVDPWAKEMAEELLKEQEPISPSCDMDGRYIVCGNCGKKIGNSTKYCTKCGRAVKWE